MKWLGAMCFVVLLLNCSSNKGDNKPDVRAYDFKHPAEKITLPKILNEISGQVLIDSVTIACVQDEKGIIFIYDLKTEEIKQQVTFAPDGDFEEITRVHSDLYILRSDGVLFEVLNYSSPTFTVNEYSTGIPADNNEGLCYDSLNNRLLLAVKGRIDNSADQKDKRAIYGFDLATKKLSAQPVYEFLVSDLVSFAEQHDIRIPMKEKKKGSTPDLKFRTSAIDIHPVTGELYVLSAVDHALFTFDAKTGATLNIEMLDEKMFNKPEGITFYGNGDVLISNEAQDKKPTLLRFNYQQ